MAKHYPSRIVNVNANRSKQNSQPKTCTVTSTTLQPTNQPNWMSYMKKDGRKERQQAGRISMSFIPSYQDILQSDTVRLSMVKPTGFLTSSSIWLNYTVTYLLFGPLRRVLQLMFTRPLSKSTQEVI